MNDLKLDNARYEAFEKLEEAMGKIQEAADLINGMVESGLVRPNPLRLILRHAAPACTRIETTCEGEELSTYKPEDYPSPWDLADAAYRESSEVDEIEYRFFWRHTDGGERSNFLQYTNWNDGIERIVDYSFYEEMEGGGPIASIIENVSADYNDD